MSQPAGPAGKNPFVASPRTPGPLGQKDAADPDTPAGFVGDTPGSLGINDYAAPDLTRPPVLASPMPGKSTELIYGGLLLASAGPLASGGGSGSGSGTFDITMIPGIMRSKGWNNGARLMEEWFAAPANADPSKGTPDTTTIRMDTWVLTFPRAKEVYDGMLSEKIYCNDPAKRLIVKKLKTEGKLGTARNSFQVISNERSVGSLDDPLDDMFAALAKFTFQILVKGFVAPKSPSEHVVTIEEVGVYVQDSYDFNGPQNLGNWDPTTNFVSKNPFDKGTWVTNGDFRDWRDTHGKGGDFLVFSDTKVTKLSVPVTFVAEAWEEERKETWIDRHR